MPGTNATVTATFNGPSYGGGSGTELDPYLITAKEDLFDLTDYPWDADKYFKMTANIDFSGTNFTSSIISSFGGVFDGAGHKISNLTGSAGLFGNNSGVINNLFIEDCSVEGSRTVGGLVGCNNGIIKNVDVSGIVNGDSYVGMLTGWNNGGISECSVGGMICDNYDPTTGYASGSASCVGGLVGFDRGSISNCYSWVDVYGKSSVGGLIGYKSGGSVSVSYSCGYVAGSFATGGLIGFDTGWATVNSSF
jgi:hypothetical protein